jgi:putative selenate reductase
LMLKRAKRINAAEIIETPLNNRKNFTLVSKTLDEKTIVDEAGRCLSCDEICNICTTVCPNFANYSYDIKPVKYHLQKALQRANGKLEIVNDEIFEVKQPYQIINIANFCNECGNCNTFCPTNSAPYKEKPKFYLTASSFNHSEEGYFLEKNENKKTLLFKQNHSTSSLTELSKEYLFESENGIVRLNKEDFRILEIKAKNNEQKEFHFQIAATMSIILKGAENLIFV